jgi:hypothetical protein
LVASVIATHPEVTPLFNTRQAQDEGQFVQDKRPDNAVMGRGVSAKRGLVVRWARHPAAHLTERDSAAYPDAGRRLLSSWSPYFATPNSTFFVEKSPPNLMKARFLQSAFEDATFVTVMRHPVINALAVKKWGTRANAVGLGLEKIVEHWFLAMDTFRRDAPQLARHCEVKLESVLIDPSALTASLSALTGL